MFKIVFCILEMTEEQPTILLRFEDVVTLMEEHGAKYNLPPPVRQQIFLRVTRANWQSNVKITPQQLLFDEKTVKEVLNENKEISS